MSVRVGVQLHPQHCTMEELLEATRACDGLKVDSLWAWDHFYPLYGAEGAPHGEAFVPPSPHEGDHFETSILLTAMACNSSHATLGHLVGCNTYRNIQLVADMARTLDHISKGRAVLGIGSGWFERDYTEYGFEFGTAISRLKDLGHNLPILEERLGKLTPPPVQKKIPILIGGGGEKVTLKLVAKHANMWNSFGPPDVFAAKNKILDQHCHDLGRNPKEVERTVLLMRSKELDQLDQYVEAGAEHIILGLGWPFSISGVQKLLEWRDSNP